MSRKISMFSTIIDALMIGYILWWLWQRRWGRCVCFGIMGACAYVIFVSGQSGPYIPAVAKHHPAMAHTAMMANLVGLVVFICTYVPWVLIDRARKIQARQEAQRVQEDTQAQVDDEDAEMARDIQVFKDNPKLLGKKWGEIGGELREITRRTRRRRVLKTNPAYLEIPDEWKNAIRRGVLQDDDEWKKICEGYLEQDRREKGK